MVNDITTLAMLTQSFSSVNWTKYFHPSALSSCNNYLLRSYSLTTVLWDLREPRCEEVKSFQKTLEEEKKDYNNVSAF